jgi:hypothetical protein
MIFISSGTILFSFMGVIILIQGIKGVRSGQMRWGKEFLEGDRARNRGTLALVIGLLMLILGLVTLFILNSY